MSTATPSFPTQIPRSAAGSGSDRQSLVSRYALDYTLFLPGIWLVAALTVSIRLIGPAFIVVPTGFCFLYAILMRVKPPRVLTLYYALCVIAAVLSPYHVFPTSWQVHYVQEAV